MQGNSLHKLVRLVTDLARHPKYIPRYFKESIGKKSPIELGLPWIFYAAIFRLERFIQKNHSIAEFGGGGSTLFFAQRAESVLCIESHKGWAEKIEQSLSQVKLSNVTIKVLPYACDDLEAYKISKYLCAIEGQKFDVILVDGYEDAIQFRPTCFWRAEECVKPGGIIVLDDSWRYPSVRQNNKAKRWEVLCSIGPCRPGVTSTDIYYY